MSKSKFDKDSLGSRMKEYESVSKTRLIKKIPVILRLDGCHFHSFCRGFNKPFDDIFIKTMQETMKYLCENIQGCVFGYTQSDEITLVLIDYQKINSSAWFDNEVQKMCSVAASMCSMKFNEFFKSNIAGWYYKNETQTKLLNTYMNAISKGAYFDCRAFNLPKEEVCNCLIWRQQDAVRNSILSLGQAYFSHNELLNKNCATIQDMLNNEKNINWNDLPTVKKRGTCCVKVDNSKIENEDEDSDLIIVNCRKKWTLDFDIPIFTQNREYVETTIYG